MLIYDAPKGVNIFGVAKAAVELSKKSGELVEFEYNDLSINVRPNSSMEDIVHIYQLTLRLKRANLIINNNPKLFACFNS